MRRDDVLRCILGKFLLDVVYEKWSVYLFVVV